jgi:hypothetical protein
MRRRGATGALATLAAGAVAAVAIADTGGGPAGATARWTPGEEPAPITVREDDGRLRLTVVHRPGGPERLTWRTRGLSATAGEDVEAAWGIVQFRPGERERVLDVAIRADGAAEGEERFAVVVEPLPGLGAPSAPASVEVTIADR